MKRFLLAALIALAALHTRADLTAADLAHADKLRAAGLSSSLAYELVTSLTTEIGPRMGGSAADARAVAWGVERMKRLGFSNVRAESFTMTAWRRGPGSAQVTAPHPQPLVMAALGNSIATPAEGIEAEIAYYEDFAALKADTSERARGRIVFIDQKTERQRFGATYGRAVQARTQGASEAAKRGALAVVIRSIGTDHDMSLDPHRLLPTASRETHYLTPLSYQAGEACAIPQGDGRFSLNGIENGMVGDIR